MLIVGNAEGAARAWLKDESALVDLDCTRPAKTLRRLRALPRAARPDVLFSTMIDANIVAALAARCRAPRPGLILRETQPASRARRYRFPAPAGDRLRLSRADAVVASVGRRRPRTDRRLSSRSGRVVTIHNPVDVDGWAARATGAANPAPWGNSAGDGPVVLGTGRLIRQKGLRPPAPRARPCKGDGKTRAAWHSRGRAGAGRSRSRSPPTSAYRLFCAGLYR